MRLRRILPGLMVWLLPDDDFWDWDPAGVPLDEDPDEAVSALDALDVDAVVNAEHEMSDAR